MDRSFRGVKAPASTVPAIWPGMTRPVGAVFPAAKLGGIPIGEGGIEPPFCREKRCKNPTRRAGPPGAAAIQCHAKAFLFDAIPLLSESTPLLALPWHCSSVPCPAVPLPCLAENYLAFAQPLGVFRCFTSPLLILTVLCAASPFHSYSTLCFSSAFPLPSSAAHCIALLCLAMPLLR